MGPTQVRQVCAAPATVRRSDPSCRLSIGDKYPKQASPRDLTPPSKPLISYMCVYQGNEGVDVKEGCQHTLIENNDISMQRDENAGGMLAAWCSSVSR